MKKSSDSDSMNGLAGANPIPGTPPVNTRTPTSPQPQRLRVPAPLPDGEIQPVPPGKDIIGPFTRVPVEDDVHPPILAARRRQSVPSVDALNDSGNNSITKEGSIHPFQL